MSDRSRTRAAKAASISRLVLALKTLICSPIARAAGSKSLIVFSVLVTLAGLTSTATRTAAGTSSRRSSSRFAVNSTLKKLIPVRLPPGRATLVTRPSLTGSSETAKTTGIVAVAALAAGGDDSDLPANQVGRQLWKPVILALRPAVDDRHILALNVADLLQTSAPGVQTVPDHVLRSGVEKPDHRHRWLLRPHRERPHGRRPAEQRDELAASYVEHGLPSWNPLCQLTAGSGCLWKRPQVLGADLICSESG